MFFLNSLRKRDKLHPVVFSATNLLNQELLSRSNANENKIMKISVTNFPLSLRIGHFQSERSFTREIFVSLELSLKAANPKELENLNKTIDYGAVLSFLEEKYSDSTYHLIETLLYQMARDLMEQFTLLDELKIKIEKTLVSPSLIKGSQISVEESFKRGKPA